MQPRPWKATLAMLSIACALAYPLGAAAADAPSGNAQRAEEKPKGTITSALSDVGDISAEVRKLEKRMESMEKSMASMSDSLAPVGALTRPEGVNALLKQVSDVAYERGVALILIATGCAALLLVLIGLFLRWYRPPHPPQSR